MVTDSGLVYAVWELTLRCDLSCGHCGSRAGKARADELSTAEALDVVRQLAEMRAMEVTLIGGEAYLRDDWHVIAKAIRDAGMKCTMTTGGRGLTRERARIAKDAGIQGVSVSIDGLEQTHDKQRGVKGSFRAALAAVENVHAEGMQTAVNTQINRLSYPELDDLFELLVTRGVRAWQVQLTVAMGRAVDHADWLLQPYELIEVMPKLAEIAKRGPPRGLHLWPGNNVGYFGPHESVLRRNRVDGHAKGCGAGKSTLGIEADGAIKGCPSLPTRDYKGGSVRELSVREIWDTTKELRFTRDRTTADLWGYCKTCYYADVCRAGCTWTAHVLFGKPGNNPYCHHRALELDARGLRERIVKREQAPGDPFDYGRFELVVEPRDSADDGAKPRKRLPLLG